MVLDWVWVCVVQMYCEIAKSDGYKHIKSNLF